METENSDEIENAENDGTGPSEHLTVKRKKLEEELKVEHSGNLMGKFIEFSKNFDYNFSRTRGWHWVQAANGSSPCLCKRRRPLLWCDPKPDQHSAEQQQVLSDASAGEQCGQAVLGLVALGKSGLQGLYLGLKTKKSIFRVKPIWFHSAKSWMVWMVRWTSVVNTPYFGQLKMRFSAFRPAVPLSGQPFPWEPLSFTPLLRNWEGRAARRRRPPMDDLPNGHLMDSRRFSFKNGGKHFHAQTSGTTKMTGKWQLNGTKGNVQGELKGFWWKCACFANFFFC